MGITFGDKNRTECIEHWIEKHKSHPNKMYLGVYPGMDLEVWLPEETAYDYLKEDVEKGDKIAKGLYNILKEVYPGDISRQRKLWLAITTMLCIASKCNYRKVTLEFIKRILSLYNVEDAYGVLGKTELYSIFDFRF